MSPPGPNAKYGVATPVTQPQETVPRPSQKKIGQVRRWEILYTGCTQQ